MSNLPMNDVEANVAATVDNLDILIHSSTNAVDAQPVENDDDAEKAAEAALDSILETSVADVNLALSHDDEAVTAAVNAAAINATTNADVTDVDEIAVTAAAAVADVAALLTTESNVVTADTISKPELVIDGVLLPSDGINLTDPTKELQAAVIETLVPTNDVGTDVLPETWDASSPTATVEKQQETKSSNDTRVGRWTLDEKILFLYGLQKYGKGHWKKISAYVPGRSLIQIKSHAQKVLKRINAGENVFRRLEENVSRLHTLVTQTHATLGLDPPTVLLQPTTFVVATSPYNTGSTRKKKIDEVKNEVTDDANREDSPNSKRPRTTKEKSTKEGTEHLAASALCQLAVPEDDEDGDVENDVAAKTIEDGGGDDVPTKVDDIKTEDDIDVGALIGI